jgi:hypothetical protein
MHVLADARALPERGSVVEQDAHRGNSLDAIKKWYREEFLTRPEGQPTARRRSGVVRPDTCGFR